MEENVGKTVEKIMAQMRCAKKFECVESEFEILCKAFALCFGAGYLCSCPLRVYVAKNLKK
ncbi:MAG: hypothetical protein ACYSYV_12235 [Planctomycetota bacterium]|jgi:hypothetical protein